MLQSERRSIRIAGIMALAEISKRAPEEYLETIISMLATFIGEQSPRIKERDSNPREEHMPPDIVEALRVLSAASIRDDQKPLVVVELSDIDFSSWTLPLGDCCEFKFLRCLFQESEINYSIFSYMFAEKCDFRGAKFKNSEFIYSAFFDCELDNASFDLCKFLEVDFHSSDFVRTIFFDVSFENTNFDSCDITLASFDALPGGDDYDFTDCVYFESEQTRAEGRDNKPKGLKESILNELRPTGF